jgi:hypothetical protein
MKIEITSRREFSENIIEARDGKILFLKKTL